MLTEEIQQLQTELFLELKGKLPPDAFNFLLCFYQYCHNIDDLVDERFDVQKLLDNYELSCLVWNSDYCVKHKDVLRVIQALANNNYKDSVDWEHCGDGTWESKYSDVLRHGINDMILAVIYLELGMPGLREYSKKIRTCSYWRHHNNITEERE